DLDAADLAETRHHRAVVAQGAVAVELDEILEHEGEVVHEVRAGGVAGEEDALPGAELGEDFALLLVGAEAEFADFFGEVDAGLAGEALELFDALFELQDRLFEVA